MNTRLTSDAGAGMGGSPVRQLAIPSQFEAMNKNLDELSVSLAALRQRLQPVLRDEPQASTAPDPKLMLGGPTIASQLARRNEMIEQAVNEVRELTRLLEL